MVRDCLVMRAAHGIRQREARWPVLSRPGRCGCLHGREGPNRREAVTQIAQDWLSFTLRARPSGILGLNNGIYEDLKDLPGLKNRRSQ